MAKVKIYEHNGWKQCWFHCEGCNCQHAFTVQVPPTEKFIPWTWNDDVNKPTFSPSLLVNDSDPNERCHSYVRGGEIQYLGDCFHHLKNKIIQLPEVDF